MRARTAVLAAMLLTGNGCEPEQSLTSQMRVENEFFAHAYQTFPVGSVALRRMADQRPLDEAVMVATALNYCKTPPCYLGLTHPDGAFVADVLRALCTETFPFPANRSELGIYVDARYADRIASIVANCPYLQGTTLNPDRPNVAIHIGALNISPPPPPLPVTREERLQVLKQVGSGLRMNQIAPPDDSEWRSTVDGENSK